MTANTEWLYDSCISVCVFMCNSNVHLNLFTSLSKIHHGKIDSCIVLSCHSTNLSKIVKILFERWSVFFKICT